MNLNIQNKNALVCGSTQGIGKASAISLAEEGVNITLIARNEDKLKTVLAELPSQRNHSYIVADFSNPEALKNKVSEYIKTHNEFHILINNTGGPKGGPVFSADVNEKNKTLTLHLQYYT